jgi:hypothetical protein
VAAVTAVIAGLGLLGSGVHGLTEVDGKLADAAERGRARDVGVRQELPRPQRCPWRREQREEFRRL